MHSLQALGSPSIVLAPIASLDGSPKILKIGPDRKLYYSVGPSCDQSGTCQCGDAVASAPQVYYCSIARVSLDGAGATSRITGAFFAGARISCALARAAMRPDARSCLLAWRYL